MATDIAVALDKELIGRQCYCTVSDDGPAGAGPYTIRGVIVAAEGRSIRLLLEYEPTGETWSDGWPTVRLVPVAQPPQPTRKAK